MEHEPGALPEDAGATLADEEEEEDPEFDGDWQRALKQSWEFASILQFCRLFSGPLKLRPFSGDQLEAALQEPDEHPMFLGELLYKLLRKERDEAYTEKAAFAWEPMLVRKLDAQWAQAFTAHPVANTDFYAIDPVSRMNVIYSLCEWRLEEDNAVKEYIRQQVDASDMADILRHEPIGEDSRGCRYFFFSDSQEDCRLYRELPPRKRPSKKHGARALWDTVCTSLEEISDFAARLGASRNKSDRALHEFLTLQLLPKLIDTVSARKKADERAAALEAMPKKRSSRLQVLQIKKEEGEKKKQEEQEERARMLKEQERIRRDRERELRLKARQDEEERMLMHAAQLRKKLGVMEPSREERYSKRIKNPDDSSNPSPGISGLSDAEHAESFQEANEQQPKQEQRHEANGVLPQPSAEQVMKQDVRLEPKAEPPQPPQPINLYPNFPMPPEMPLGAGPSVDAWQGVEQADAGFVQQGRQPRGRQQQAQRMQGRKREHSPGWSPIGVHVQKCIRCESCAAFKVPRQLKRHVKTRRNKNMSGLSKFGKPLPPPKLDDYYEGADLSSSESEEKPPPRSRARRRRAKSEDSDPDYEGEQSERSGARARAARRTTAASGAHAHQEQGYSQSYMQAQRQQQEQHHQRQQLMARYHSATPMEQERIRQQLMAQRQQQMMQQQGLMQGLGPSMPGSPSTGGFDSQAALRQQMAMQQRQEAMRLLSTLTPEQREQLGRLPPVQQNQFLEQLRQNHMAQQREAAARQQAASADALRLQELQQRVLASLSPQQLQQLRSMPREAQQASLNGLMQRYHMAEQHRQLQRQQGMQQMGQPSESGSLSSLQGSQHMTGSQAFPQQRMQQMGDQSRAFSQHGMQPLNQSNQGRPAIPDLHPSMPDPGMGGWRSQGLQSGAERLSPSSAMLEPLPVQFAPQPGSAAAPLRPLHQGRDGFGPGAGTQGLSPRAGFGERDGSVALQQGPSHSPRFDTRPSPHGGIPSERSHRLEAEQAAGSARLDAPGSPHYSAPVTTGHDKQQGLAQTHGPGERVNLSSAQVTSGAPQPMKPGPGQHTRPGQSASQPQSRPASSPEPPVVIITSLNPPSLDLKPPAPFEHGSGPLASPAQQPRGDANEAGEPEPNLDEDRCPSPIPVTLDDFKTGQGEEGVEDLQELELPWASKQSPSPGAAPADDAEPVPPPEDPAKESS